MTRFNTVSSWIIMGLATIGIVNVLIFFFNAMKFH